MGQLLLCQHIQRITLIFAFIQGFFQNIPAILFLNPGIVPGDNGLAAQLPGPLKEAFKFQIAVAVDTGVRGRSALICGNKSFDYLSLEVSRKVEHIIRDAQVSGHTSGILHIFQRTAGLCSADSNVERYEDGQLIVIAPGEVIYSQIYELMWIGDNFSARVEGRSRVARLGLSVHCTGSYINPGFCGAMPLQLINHNKFPITIYPYIGICQLVLFQISGEPLVKYSERSRIYNPYFDERIAGPSVLRPDDKGPVDSQSIVEQRMTQLVKDYYKGIEPKKRNRQKQRMEDQLIEKIVFQQVQQVQQGSFVQMRDMYTATQAGNQGPNSGQGAIIIQSFNDSGIDYSALLQELEKIRKYLKTDDTNVEADILLGEVSKASKAIQENQKQTAIQILKGIGEKLYDIVKTIGCTIVAKIITNQAGL